MVSSCALCNRETKRETYELQLKSANENLWLGINCEENAMKRPEPAEKEIASFRVRNGVFKRCRIRLIAASFSEVQASHVKVVGWRHSPNIPTNLTSHYCDRTAHLTRANNRKSFEVMKKLRHWIIHQGGKRMQSGACPVQWRSQSAS